MPFAADLPLPPNWSEPPALIAKAKVEMRKWGRVTLSDEPGFKKVITSCLDVPKAVSFNEAADVLAYLGYRFDPAVRKYVPPLADDDVKVIVLEHPKHGTLGDFPNGKGYGYWLTDREADGSASYHGWDKVVYQVEVKGQKFKVVFDLLSVPDSDADGGQICELRPRVKKGWASLANPGLDNRGDSARFSAALAQAHTTLDAPASGDEGNAHPPAIGHTQ